MGNFKLKHFFCLVLAAITLAASFHHSLCTAGVIHCPPCQIEGSEGEDACVACSTSRSIAKTSLASAKCAAPVMAVCIWTDHFTALLLVPPLKDTEPFLTHLDFVTPQKSHYLRDLAKSAPIRGPSLTA